MIPLLNEAESLLELYQWIHQSFSKQKKYLIEVLFVDDGSSDDSWLIIKKLSENNHNVGGIKFLKNVGKATALNEGFQQTTADIIVTMDADLQDSPEEILPMLNMLIDHNLDLVSGWKKRRYDSLIFKNIPSKIFNWAARKVSNIPLHDFNCGLKVYRREVAQSIELYGDMHRYIPVLVSANGFNKIAERVVKHQSRKFGKSKFGTDRFLKGALDLLTLWFINRFGKRPMHFFGLFGSLVLLIGLGVTLYLGIDKVYIDTDGKLITQRPEFFIALTMVILGGQFFIAGFIGELISRGKIQRVATKRKNSNLVIEVLKPKKQR